MGAARSIDHDAVRQLRANGLSYRGISKILGCSEEGARAVVVGKERPPVKSPWTDERVALLKRHFDQGLSASQSAQALGGCTRNAVIAKRDRLGLRTSPDRLRATRQTANTNKPRRAPPAKRTEPVARPVAKPVINAPVNFQVRPYIEPKPAPVQPTTPLVDVSQAKPEYRRNQCNWPIGDGEPMLFCCAPVHPGSMLCPGHRLIGRQPAKDKRPERGARHLSRVDGIDLQRVDERIVPLDRLFG